MKVRKTIAIVLAVLMVLAAVPMTASANPTATQVGSTGVYFCFGSPAKADTFPEKNMSLSLSSGTTYNAVYSDSTYYPSELSVYAYDVDSSSNTVRLVTQDDTAVHFEIYDDEGNATELSSIQYSTNNNYNDASGAYEKSNLFAVKIEAAGDVDVYRGSTKKFTIHFSAPVSNGSNAGASGTHPKAVTGYLPIGQFATGSAWGSAYANGPMYGSTVGTTPKFVGGYYSTGVSLGLLGGYVQFEMNDGNLITNDASHPYGIDFIVYGNSFSGNPEAAAVMVSKNGKDWYNLAGSRHYMAGTVQNTDISYIRLTTDGYNTYGSLNSAFTKAGIYCSTDFDPTVSSLTTAISNATWTGVPLFNGNTAVPGVGFWPEYGSTSDQTAAKGYNRLWDSSLSTMTPTDMDVTGNTGKVYWNRDLTANGLEVITYCGITRVQDDMVILGSTASSSAMNDCYQWGYADVRPNGSSYGTAINPYANAGSVAGGDGFDLSWAVDKNGNPVSIDNVKYVRVYSAVLFHAGMFGETSAEICGLYRVSASGGGSANSDVEIWADDAEEPETLTEGGVTRVAPGSYTIYSDEANVFVNGERQNVTIDDGETFSVALGERVQILTQNGTSAPFLTVLLGSNES